MDEFSERHFKVGDIVTIHDAWPWFMARFRGVLWRVMITNESDPRIFPTDAVVVVRLDEFGGSTLKLTGDLYSFSATKLRLAERR